jgi:hypothetical protein
MKPEATSAEIKPAIMCSVDFVRIGSAELLVISLQAKYKW